MIIGQVAKVNYKDGSFEFGYVKEVFDNFYLVQRKMGTTCVYKSDRNAPSRSEHVDFTELVYKDGKPVVLKRKTYLFGLIKGEYFYQPQEGK